MTAAKQPSSTPKRRRTSKSSIADELRTLYPEDAELFSHTLASGVTIWLPLNFEAPDAVFLWELYDKPTHVQTWEWMRKANVPREIQRKCVELLRDDPESYLKMFDAWFEAAGGASVGE